MKKVLYLGLNPPPSSPDIEIIHYPVIQIVPRSPENPDITFAFKKIPEYTHLIFTSQNSVEIFFRYLHLFKFSVLHLIGKNMIAVGQKTGASLKDHGIEPIIADDETAEGIIKKLEEMNNDQAYFFWPHSALSRPILKQYFEEKEYRYHESILYDTWTLKHSYKPNLAYIEEIVFTSPSTVDGFLSIFGALPTNKTLTAIGPITQQKLDLHLHE